MGLSRSGTFDLVNMFSRAALTCSPASTQVRGMATLRDINNRLKAVKNIQKITKSMKIVSAAKFSRAEKELSLMVKEPQHSMRRLRCSRIQRSQTIWSSQCHQTEVFVVVFIPTFSKPSVPTLQKKQQELMSIIAV